MQRVVKNHNGYVLWVGWGGEVSYTDSQGKAFRFTTSHRAHDVAWHCGGKVYKLVGKKNAVQ